MTSIAKVVASVAQMALQNPGLDLIRDLERDSQILDRIGDNFGQAHAGRLVFCRGTGYNRNREGVYVTYLWNTRFNSN